MNTEQEKKVNSGNSETYQRFKSKNIMNKNSKMMIRVSNYNGLACFNTLIALIKLVKQAIKKSC